MSDPTSRLEQLGYLMTAMIAVIVSGHSDLTPPANGEALKQITSENVYKIDRKEFLNGGRYFGVFSRVSASLGVTPSYVSHISNGTMRSEKVLNAIASEIRLIDERFREIPSDRLSPVERAEFRAGGKYWGIYQRVARSLGLDHSSVSKVGRGLSASKRVITVIRIEMAKVDAALNDPDYSPMPDGLKKGGKYWGVFTTVANTLGISSSVVRRVARGKRCGGDFRSIILRAIREEIARVDAELASKDGVNL